MEPEILGKSPLFRGFSGEELRSLLKELGGSVRTYGRQSYLLRAGERTEQFALLLEGEVTIIQEDFWGNRNIVAQIMPGEVFAESYACVPGSVLRVSACAQTDCRVMWLDMRHLLDAASRGDTPRRLLRNLTAILAAKNLMMNEKITHLSQRTIREKLLSFLSAESGRCGSAEFDIAFSRQQMADYLSVDRSALSAELGRMRDEGILAFHRNHFHLLRAGDREIHQA